MRVRRLLPPLLLAAAAAALAFSHSGEIRARAERALERGMPPREAALARGLVLGEDEGVGAQTTEDFRRSGLSHLLAVSGQNVALLVLLAMPFLATLGMPLRTRLVWILGLIAVYVPLAGAGPSIQRAGIMGALSVLATLAGRRASRLYALVIAALILLILEPGIAADVGWQLSFAALLGILLLGAQLRTAIAERIGSGGLRRSLAEGGAMTISATLATAPLIAFHFEAISTMTLFANLLALPAVAPAMWLGMLAAATGQVPGFPVEMLNAPDALLLAYIAQVATWCGRPSWAYLHVHLGPNGLLGSYLAIGAVVSLALRLGRHRRIAALRNGRVVDRPAPRPRSRLPVHRQRLPLASAAIALSLAVIAFAWTAAGGSAGERGPIRGLRVSVLDVGQGDAILLQPRAGPPILVDGGPLGDDLAAELRAAGVERLGAVVVTHDQSDHAGGIRELLGRMSIGQLLYGVLARSSLIAVHAAGVPTRRLARGSELRSGRLRLAVLWPPAELLAGPYRGDPNRLAVVMLAQWGHFSMLLTADAESEVTPLDPGPIDVLKVAHHGSDDSGLAGLLDRTEPRLAVISAGADNPFGHPTAATLATLAEHGIRTLRTDREGTIVFDVARGSIEVSSGG